MLFYNRSRNRKVLVNTHTVGILSLVNGNFIAIYNTQRVIFFYCTDAPPIPMRIWVYGSAKAPLVLNEIAIYAAYKTIFQRLRYTRKNNAAASASEKAVNENLCWMRDRKCCVRDKSIFIAHIHTAIL